MITTGKRLQRMSFGLTLSVLVTATDLAAANAGRTADHGRQRQIVVSIGPFDAFGPSGSSFAWATRLPGGVMLHRVIVELVDSAGRPFDGAAEWEASLAGGSTAMPVPLMHGRTLVREFDLPRPLGLRLEADDSIAVRGHVRTPHVAVLHVRITLEFEPLGGPLSRFGVLPVQLHLSGAGDSADDGSGARTMREWQAPVDARVMVLVGLPIDAAGVLVLEDIESGATLWHEILQPVTGEGFGQTAGVVRVGVAVDAGRTYRLTLNCTAADTVCASDRLVHALLAPVRTAVTVALRD